MEGRGQEMALADQHRRTLTAGKDFDSGARFDDPWGADKNHLKRAAGKGGLGRKDCGVDLAAVSVALNGSVEQAQGALRRVYDFTGEEDRSGAGAEDGLFLAELLKGFKETVLLEEAENGGGFAAGQDDAVDAGELFGFAHLHRLCTRFGESVSVRGIVALDGENTDFVFGELGQFFPVGH